MDQNNTLQGVCIDSGTQGTVVRPQQAAAYC